MFGLASSKLQLEPLYFAASKLGLSPRTLALDVTQPSLLNLLGTPEVCIIGKINHFEDDRVEGFAMAILAAICRLKAIKTKIVLLYCDHLASRDCVRGSLYRELLILCDHCIVPSNAMAQLVSPFLLNKTQLSVIEDPWQVQIQPYRNLADGEPLKIAWFGNTSNAPFVCDRLFNLMVSISSVPSVEFRLLSKQRAIDMIQPIFEENISSAIRPWTLKSFLWNHKQQPSQLERFLGSSHISWLPSDPRNLLKAGISHNRLVDSVRSGCVPVTSNMHSYSELRKVAVIGENHADLIDKVAVDYQRIAAKHDSIRVDYLNRFSPSHNLLCWEKVLRNLHSLPLPGDT